MKQLKCTVFDFGNDKPVLYQTDKAVLLCEYSTENVMRHVLRDPRKVCYFVQDEPILHPEEISLRYITPGIAVNYYGECMLNGKIHEPIEKAFPGMVFNVVGEA